MGSAALDVKITKGFAVHVSNESTSVATRSMTAVTAVALLLPPLVEGARVILSHSSCSSFNARGTPPWKNTERRDSSRE
jgi:hypothetical protein